jgi:ATP-dependent RNA helicase SUPV3L1/SUV3
MTAVEQPPRLMAVLGPTNTGKTHFAIDRMLGHPSGMIGFPLRLLARENYDRVVALKGASRVALITGEEKIVPPRPDYFVCTVESMPMDRAVDFLAIDEIQMCADPERGHVFTDRLLRARGRAETLLLGADTIRPLIQKLVPGCEFVTRPRLSRLTYTGPRKITRLPRRSAVVAFSINEVYAIAELMRRQRGGTAVVLGALSPRTRNAQVEMYQGGDVDYLVATDAIGMGLNMNIDHVAFAGVRKFDGRTYRALTTAEIAQIAGRAGRHLSDGTFGPVAETGAFDEATVSAIEEHRFDPLTAIHWRSSDLDFRSGLALQKSLEAPPPRTELMRARDADDKVALAHLLRDRELADRASNPDAVRLLWEVCQIPDFRKTMADVHAGLLARIYRELTGAGRLPADWVAAQIAQLDRVDGDIDTLMARIAHVRTWTYISHRADWIADAETWQGRTRELEDKLSDALHHSLTQRFVDRRAAALTRMKDRDDLAAVVGADGDVTVEGEFVGRLDGFRFAPDPNSAAEGRKALMAAANRALKSEIDARVDALAGAPDAAFSRDAAGWLMWSGAVVARLAKGADIVSPGVTVLASDYLTAEQRERMRVRLAAWVAAQLEDALERLMALRRAELTGVPRGLAYRIVEGLGSLPRLAAVREVRELTKEDRLALRACGVRIGAETLFIPALVKPKAVEWRALLWALFHQRDVLTPPAPGLVTVPAGDDVPVDFLAACGYVRLGGRAVRIDVLDRLAVDLQRQSRAGAMTVGPAQLNLLGLSLEAARPVIEALGYGAEETEAGLVWKWQGRRKPKPEGERPAGKGPRRDRKAKGKRNDRDGGKQPDGEREVRKEGARSGRRAEIDENSPFAKLRELKFS